MKLNVIRMTFLSVLLCSISMLNDNGLLAQVNRAPKMAPIYEKGYYVTSRGDTVRGKIQVNPANELDFYQQFFFALPKAKPRKVTAPRAVAYGFGDRNFVLKEVDGQKLFLERLVSGRLRFYEYQKVGKVNGYEGNVSLFYIFDSQAEDGNKELKRLPEKFYKKALKPYLADQPMIWSDLDKYEFNKTKVVGALKEFNGFYAAVGN